MMNGLDFNFDLFLFLRISNLTSKSIEKAKKCPKRQERSAISK